MDSYLFWWTKYIHVIRNGRVVTNTYRPATCTATVHIISWLMWQLCISKKEETAYRPEPCSYDHATCKFSPNIRENMIWVTEITRYVDIYNMTDKRLKAENILQTVVKQIGTHSSTMRTSTTLRDILKETKLSTWSMYNVEYVKCPTYH